MKSDPEGPDTLLFRNRAKRPHSLWRLGPLFLVRIDPHPSGEGSDASEICGERMKIVQVQRSAPSDNHSDLLFGNGSKVSTMPSISGTVERRSTPSPGSVPLALKERRPSKLS